MARFHFVGVIIIVIYVVNTRCSCCPFLLCIGDTADIRARPAVSDELDLPPGRPVSEQTPSVSHRRGKKKRTQKQEETVRFSLRETRREDINNRRPFSGVSGYRSVRTYIVHVWYVRLIWGREYLLCELMCVHDSEFLLLAERAQR